MRVKPGHHSTYSGFYTSPITPQQPQFAVVVDGRQQSGSHHQHQASQSGHGVGDLFDASIAAPPLAYSANAARYAPYPTTVGNSAGGGGATTGTGFDVSFDPQRDGLNAMYQPMQPYQSGGRFPAANQMAGAAGGSAGGAAQQQQQPSLYSAHVPAGLFGPAAGTGHSAQQGSTSQQQQQQGPGW